MAMAWLMLCTLVALLLSTLAQAQNLEIVLLDNQGKPLSDAVLWIEPGPAQSQPATAVMDQQKRQFTPERIAIVSRHGPRLLPVHIDGQRPPGAIPHPV